MPFLVYSPKLQTFRSPRSCCHLQCLHHLCDISNPQSLPGGYNQSSDAVEWAHCFHSLLDYVPFIFHDHWICFDLGGMHSNKYIVLNVTQYILADLDLGPICTVHLKPIALNSHGFPKRILGSVIC